MASNTQNVKLGVCRVRFGGVDVGYTKGGVDFTVTTETHKVMVDQFGNSEIDEIIMGRSAKVTLPLAESTLDNIVKIMPGAVLKTDGVKATGTIVFAAAPASADTVTVNGTVFTFKTAALATGILDVPIGVASTLPTRTAIQNSASNFLLALQSSTNIYVDDADYTIDSATGLTITATYGLRGTAGNAFTLAKSATGPTVPATLTGGIASTRERVDVTRNVGVSLLAISQELVLHPMSAADNDYSQDVILPKTATAGALNFAYKFDTERVFNIEFNAYPDSDSTLFKIGDKRAV